MGCEELCSPVTEDTNDDLHFGPHQKSEPDQVPPGNGACRLLRQAWSVVVDLLSSDTARLSRGAKNLQTPQSSKKEAPERRAVQRRNSFALNWNEVCLPRTRLSGRRVARHRVPEMSVFGDAPGRRGIRVAFAGLRAVGKAAGRMRSVSLVTPTPNLQL